MQIPIEVFISHADEDKTTAKEIAVEMRKRQGVNVFVAHDDLDPGANWKSDLTQKIYECDAFVVLLTKDFHSAEWTEQEVGIAHTFKKRMIPIRFDKTATTGFMTDFQATKISWPIESSEIATLTDVIVAYSDEGQRHINGLIEQLRNSGSFIDANGCARILFNATTKFTPEQINKIANAYLENYEIRGGYVSEPLCLDLFQKNWKKIDESTREELKPHLQSS